MPPAVTRRRWPGRSTRASRSYLLAHPPSGTLVAWNKAQGGTQYTIARGRHAVGYRRSGSMCPSASLKSTNGISGSTIQDRPEAHHPCNLNQTRPVALAPRATPLNPVAPLKPAILLKPATPVRPATPAKPVTPAKAGVQRLSVVHPLLIQ